jgi:manganese efflux pump family protein
MLALILVAVAVGASNMAASVGLGAGGVSLGTRLRVILIFGLLEAGMPVVGLLIGHGLAADVSRESRWLAACLLVAIGGYGIVKAVREGGLAGIWPGRSGSDGAAADAAGAGPGGRAGNPGAAGTAGRGQSLKLLATGIALSLDNLVAGFALGAERISVVLGAVVFGVVSIAMSLAGLEVGALIGKRASGGSGDLIGGAVLIGVGVAIGTGTLS